jgi:hypothetical protein
MYICCMEDVEYQDIHNVFLKHHSNTWISTLASFVHIINLIFDTLNPPSRKFLFALGKYVFYWLTNNAGTVSSFSCHWKSVVLSKHL